MTETPTNPTEPLAHGQGVVVGAPVAVAATSAHGHDAAPSDRSLAHSEVGPEETSQPLSGRRRERISAFSISFVVHFVAVIVLALIGERLAASGGGISLVAEFDQLDELVSLDEATVATRVENDTKLPADYLRDQAVEGSDAGPPELVRVDEPQPALAEVGLRSPSPVNWMLPVDSLSGGGGTEGRQGETRATLLRLRGGTDQSELAVARGLRWLAAHQRDDGGWSFDHTRGLCRGSCRNAGSEASTTAATAMALLAFLGAGFTHRDGEYQDTVQRGLYYLSVRAVVSPHGVDLQEGTMYGQGLATLALCEAYGMTRDPALKDLAQRSVRFVLYAQDQKGGGWRYTPGEPGDTTVTGWQFMALKSAEIAGLEVSSPSIGMAARFLDSVQVEEGAQYGYMTPVPKRSTTAIGLLCRMYTGWRRDHAPLAKGVAYLGQWGPSNEEIYYNYYATQVLCHFGGPHWEKWNLRMREHLIATQAGSGHEAGSWFFANDPGAEKGGRLYYTALAVMTLEVYYRYMPLYGSQSVDRSF